MELYHHGVLGMHWGVWNEETAARRNGRLKYIDKPLTDRKKNKYKLNSDGTLSKNLVNDITKTYSQNNQDDHAKVWDKRIKEAGVSLDDIERYRHKYTYDGSKKSRKALDNIINNSPTGKQKEKQRVKDAEQYAKDVNDIYNSMSEQEKMNIQSRYGYRYHPETLINTQTAYDAIKKGAAFIEKENDTPVSFLYLTEGGYDNVVVGTRRGAEFRNKGYAQKNIEKSKRMAK